MNASSRTTTPAQAPWHEAIDALKLAWKRLPVAPRCALVMGPWVAAGLLLALAQTCEQAVHRGEQLRAEQRQRPLGASTDVPLRTAAAPGVATGL